MSENGEIYTTGKNFTLPPALTAWTISTSASPFHLYQDPGRYRGPFWNKLFLFIFWSAPRAWIIDQCLEIISKLKQLINIKMKL